jgi:hypothetical protein
MEYILFIHNKILEYAMLKRHNPVLRRDQVHWNLFHFTDPLSKDVWTMNRSREQDKANRRWQEDQTLLPHLSSRWVVEVMDLVEDYSLNTV